MTKPKPYNPLPAAGDIVYCNFPEVIGIPGPKARPALVIGVAPTTHEVTVVYGTSQRTHKIYPTEFLMSLGDSGFPTSGLDRDTKFDFAERVKLPFDTVWFEPGPAFATNSPLPKMGSMHVSYYSAAQAALKRAT